MARLGIDKALLRRGEVIKVLGLSRSEMKNMVERTGFEFVESDIHNGWARLVCRKL